MLRATLLLLAGLLCTPATADILDIFRSDKLTDGSRFAFAPSSVANKVIAIDVIDQNVAAVLELPHAVGSVVATNELDLLVATHPDSNSATVINLYNRQIVAELELGMRPDVVLPNTYDRLVTFGRMRACDQLYGVTMQERGVSTRVSVRVEDLSTDGRISTEALKEAETPDGGAGTSNGSPARNGSPELPIIETMPTASDGARAQLETAWEHEDVVPTDDP